MNDPVRVGVTISDLFSQFDNADLGSLKTSADRTSKGAEEVFDEVAERGKARVARANQQNSMRAKFFRWSSWVAVGIIVGDFIIVGYYCWVMGPNIAPNVMLFWISSSVVQILGIIFIIAQYLFPKHAVHKRHTS